MIWLFHQIQKILFWLVYQIQKIMFWFHTNGSNSFRRERGYRHTTIRSLWEIVTQHEEIDIQH